MAVQGEAQEWTPLHHAALRGHMDMVKLLLSHGANIDARDRAVGPQHYLSYHALPNVYTHSAD